MVERLTVTQADLGCQATFINFRPVFQTQTIYPLVSWGTTLQWILPFYKTPHLIAMNNAMEMLPDKAGTKNSRKAIYNKLYAAYYKDTGFDVDTGKEPKGDNKIWVEEQVKKEHQRKTQIAKAVKSKKEKA